jgi:plasmid maintenance system antidote protein VapI
MTARERLTEWLRRSRMNQREAATELGVHWTTLNQILKGRRSPGVKNALRLQRLAGIPVEDWLTTDDAHSGTITPDTARVVNVGGMK